MSRHSERTRPYVSKAPILIAVIIALIVVGVLLGKLAAGVPALLSMSGEDAHDPQFPIPTENVTRPPDLSGEGEYAAGGDQSQNWVYEVQTPVDKTAAQLQIEAMGENAP
ncbi:MAG: hypothetical protein IJH38_06450 [Clostridia bacterium]|nr:hypothetical protein [Clostridia bacterium]